MSITRPRALSDEEARAAEAAGEPIDKIRRSPKYVEMLELGFKAIAGLLWMVAIWQFDRITSSIEELQTQGQEQSRQNSTMLEQMKALALRQDSAVQAAQSAVLQFERTEKETRMLEYYLLELDAKFISAGLKSADNSIAQKLAQKRGQENP